MQIIVLGWAAGRDEKVHDGWRTVEYLDTCFRSEPYTSTCTRSVYNSKSCTGTRSNGDGSFESYSYECGSSDIESYPCTETRMVPYSCPKTRQEEIFHYEDIWDTFFVYDIDKWVKIADYPTQGNNHQPMYAQVSLTNPYLDESVPPQLGQQTSENAPGQYTVTFCTKNEKVGDDGCFTRDLSLPEWLEFTPGEYSIEVNWMGIILSEPTL